MRFLLFATMPCTWKVNLPLVFEIGLWNGLHFIDAFLPHVLMKNGIISPYSRESCWKLYTIVDSITQRQMGSIDVPGRISMVVLPSFSHHSQLWWRKVDQQKIPKSVCASVAVQLVNWVSHFYWLSIEHVNSMTIMLNATLWNCPQSQPLETWLSLCSKYQHLQDHEKLTKHINFDGMGGNFPLFS